MAEAAPTSQLVVIGSSAGGVEVLMALVSTLPAEFASLPSDAGLPASWAA